MLWLAIRPKTLLASVSPVILATAISAKTASINWLVAGLILLCALLIQIISNLANDLGDFKRGADQDRVGPTRVTQSGLISTASMQRLIWGTVVVTLLLGLFLVAQGGLPILIIGLVSIVCALLYTTGPYPLAYNGLGEIFVFIFFGPVAVAGAVYLLSGTVLPGAVILGAGCGALAAAILVVNNIRDLEQDKKVNKNTLAVRWGKRQTERFYLMLVLAGALTPLLYCKIVPERCSAALGSLVLVLGILLYQQLKQATIGEQYNAMLAKTSALLFSFSMLTAIGIWIS